MPASATATLDFPSVEWFERLGQLMEEYRARHEHIGPIDCLTQFTVLDPEGEGRDRHFQITFELYSAISVREVIEEESSKADFIMETDTQVWQEMIENIRDNAGRPDLEHSLNRLSLPGTPIRVWAEDPLGRDMFFRFNQSLQEFVNASVHVPTRYPDLGE
ncbi:MAG TPA: hypothetical protein VGO87_02770 [Acidimicrobiia bacterium]|jgi:hypothetical protein